MRLIMKHFSYFIPFLFVFGFTACSHNHDAYHLMQAERIFESDTTIALELLYRIPTETIQTPDFSYVHDVSCIENVYYCKILHEIEYGDIEKAQNLASDLIKDLIVYKDKNTLLKDKESGIFDFPILVYKNLVLINSSVTSDNLLYETKKLLKQNIYQQMKTHWKNETLFIEYKLFNSKYYYYIIFFVSAILFFCVYRHYKSSVINNLNLKMIRNENEMMNLSKQVKIYQKNTFHHLGIGKKIFESIKEGGTMKNISIENEQNFIDYYAFRFPQDYTDIISNYKSLSLRHTSYLILKKMNFLDKDIKRILFVQDSTIRNYRLRIKRQLK